MMENRFVIVVTVYNAVSYIERCLLSIKTQDYPNFIVVVVDDLSTDGTWDKILAFKESPFILIRNLRHTGSAVGNIAMAIQQYTTGEDIIGLVDGDDSLAHNSVLSELNEAYKNKDVYMTYGQFIPQSGSYGPYCRHIPDTRVYRAKKQWYAGHFRTFKRKLWDAIKDTDLRDEKGEYYKAGGDGAYLYPMVEICGHRHMRFISKVNYLYNDINPSNDMKINRKQQASTAARIRTMPPYAEIDEL